MKANKFIIYFILKAAGVYAGWYIIYDLWLKKSGVFDNWIVENIVYSAFKILTFFNYDVNIDHNKLWIVDAKGSVIIGSGCDGLELYVLFIGFILIFAGSWKNKIWFIPVGVLVLYFLNVLRVIALTLNGLVSVSLLRFNHKYTFTIILYVVTFLGWMIWVKYFSETSNVKNEETEIE